jgi:uncharacterized membrane protein (UPF0127 family)
MPEERPADPRGRVVGRLYGDDGRALCWVGVCDTIRTRRRGLLGVDALALDEAILLTPCRSIHTMGMRIPIDVAFLDHELRVIAVKEEMRPGKFLVTRRLLGTHCILEAAGGAFAEWRLRVGESLRLEVEAA